MQYNNAYYSLICDYHRAVLGAHIRLRRFNVLLLSIKYLILIYSFHLTVVNMMTLYIKLRVHQKVLSQTI